MIPSMNASLVLAALADADALLAQSNQRSVTWTIGLREEQLVFFEAKMVLVPDVHHPLYIVVVTASSWALFDYPSVDFVYSK